ncbi:type VII secretion protein EccE [Nocardia spumae]|uniref:type VII secretion protein EccE n=1 Tax=Nocardia spumae TaxID=2887190 RepID=UPI001D13BC94|nr:type VII secretion protein EccE [Nocardia spumae]
MTASIAASFVLVGLWGHAPLWVGPIIVVVMAGAVLVRVDGRTAVRWFLDWCVFRAGMNERARERARVREIHDVEVAAGVCGIHADDSTLVAMIQLAPDLDLPTVIGEETLYTEDVVPIDALVSMLDQYGIAVDIDIVTTGQRVRPASSYSMLYDQLLGTHPVVGERMTWLVLRLDQQRNLTTLARRGPVEVTGPKALATAAHRIASRLRERGISAHALPADALREATRLLHAGVEPAELRERWGQLESPASGRCVTSFAIDWTRLHGAGLDDCWNWNRGRTTLVVSLAGGALGQRGIVRYVGPPVTSAPADYLRRLGGRQSTALLATLPTGTAVSALPRDDTGNDLAAPGLLAELPITIGPNGQILGSISGRPQHALALPLFDPARYNPRRRTIDVHADLPVAQQIVLRAMVVGADVEVHSARPHRWSQLVSAVGDPSSLRLAAESGNSEATGGGTESPATIAVFDQVSPHASTAHTTVTINDPGTARRKSVDLAINQVTATSVDVSIPMRTVRVDLIEPRGETRYYDNPAPAAAPTGEGPAITAPQVGGPGAG